MTEFIDKDGQSIYVTILKWIPGEIIEKDDSEYYDNLYLTGIMLGEFHNFSMNWNEGKRFDSPIFDNDYLDDINQNISKGIHHGIINEIQMKIVSDAIEFIKGKLIEMNNKYSKSWYGVTHCDISKSNLIVYKNKVTPIDFCLSTINYFFSDIACFFAGISEKESRERFLKGYRTKRNIEQEHLPYIEIFFVVSILEFMSLHIDNEKRHEWFFRRLDAVCNDYILPLLSNQRFLEI